MAFNLDRFLEKTRNLNLNLTDFKRKIFHFGFLNFLKNFLNNSLN